MVVVKFFTCAYFKSLVYELFDWCLKLRMEVNLQARQLYGDVAVFLL